MEDHVSFDDRLTVTEPIFRPEEDYSGHALMGIRRGNNQMQKHFEEVRDELAHLLINVRWGKLHTPKSDFAVAIGISPNGYKPMEEDRKEGGIPHRIKYTKLLSYWKEHGISPGIREQCLLLLDPRETINAFYNRAGYELGHGRVEEEIPSLYNTLWQRQTEERSVVPKCLEILQHVDLLYPNTQEDMEMSTRRSLRIEEMRRVWAQEKLEQYRSRNIEGITALLLIRLEHFLAANKDQSLTVKNVCEAFNVSEGIASKLLQKDPVPLGDIQPIVDRLFTGDEVQKLSHEWPKIVVEQQKQTSFRQLMESAMKRKNLNFAQLARALNIRLPEERDPNYVVPERSQRYRGDSEVRRTVQTNSHSWLCPIDAVIACVADSKEEEEVLLKAYKEERIRFYTRTGKNAVLSGEGLTMRIMRERAGMRMKDLAAMLMGPDADSEEIRALDLQLQKLERNETTDESICMNDILRTLEQHATKRKRDAVRRMETPKLSKKRQERNKNGSTRPAQASIPTPCPHPDDPDELPFFASVDNSRLAPEEMQEVLLQVLDSNVNIDNIVMQLQIEKTDSLYYLAHLGDRVHVYGESGRIDVIAERIAWGYFQSPSDHPRDIKRVDHKRSGGVRTMKDYTMY